METRFARHRRNHEAFVAGIEALGMRMHVAQPHRLWTLNTPCIPEGVNDLNVRKHMLANHGIEIAGGLGPLGGKVFRIGTMGHGSTPENIAMLLGAFEEALRAEGFQPKASARDAALARG